MRHFLLNAAHPHAIPPSRLMDMWWQRDVFKYSKIAQGLLGFLWALNKAKDLDLSKSIQTKEDVRCCHNLELDRDVTYIRINMFL